MLQKIEKAVACICVTIMSILVFANVIARYAFNHSLAFSDEMATYLFILMSFMGTAVAARRGAHLGLSIVTDRLSEKGRRIVGSVMYSLSALFCLLIVYYGIQMVISEYSFGQKTAAMQWPEWIYGLFVPVGACFAMIAFATSAYNIAKHGSLKGNAQEDFAEDLIQQATNETVLGVRDEIMEMEDK